MRASLNLKACIIEPAHAHHVALTALALFGLAFAARALSSGLFLTADEPSIWFPCVETFLRDLQRGNLFDTCQTAYPAVPLMWLGAAGGWLHQVLSGAGWLPPDDAALYRATLRLPTIAAVALTVALAYPLLLRLFGGGVALLAVLLWAADPFLVAHGRLLHPDGLLAAFLPLALLLALVALRFDSPPESLEAGSNRAAWAAIRWPLLAASAVVGGLALLTKLPAVTLLPMVGLILLVGILRATNVRVPGGFAASLACFLRYGLLPLSTALAVWGAIALATWLVLWPATWVKLPEILAFIIDRTLVEGGRPHRQGNFFLGQMVDDPGPLFYPVALVFRLTPWVLVGIVGSAAGLRRLSRPGQHTALVLLVAFALLYIGVMSASPKKFDRYLQPVFPVLDTLAAVGFAWLFAQLRGLPLNMIHRSPLVVQQVGIAALGLLAVLNLAWYHPYELAYYNPLLGGGPVAVRTLFVGWGEGLDQAGRSISAQPDGCERPIITWYYRVVEQFACAPVLNERRAPVPGKIGYVILYVNQLQRSIGPQSIDLLYGKVPPIHTVTIHGIDYALIYRLEPAHFGPGIYLHDYRADMADVRAAGSFALEAGWRLQQPLTDDYTLSLAVFDAAGQQVSHTLAQPAAVPGHTWPTGEIITTTSRVPLPVDAPVGDYWLGLGMVQPDQESRLPLQGLFSQASVSDYASDTLLLPFRLPFGAAFASGIYLRDYEIATADIRSTGNLWLNVKWQAAAPVDEDYMLFIHVLDAAGHKVSQIDVPPAGPAAPTSTWQPDTTHNFTHRLPLTADLPAGNYRLALGLYRPGDLSRLPVNAPAQFATPPENADRLLLPFTLP